MKIIRKAKSLRLFNGIYVNKSFLVKIMPKLQRPHIAISVFLKYNDYTENKDMKVILTKQNKFQMCAISAFVAIMLVLYIFSFFGFRAFDEIYFYASSIFLFISVVIAYTFFGYNQTRDGRIMSCMTFLFAACIIILGLLSESVFVVGNPLSVVYPIFAIYYIFMLCYMYPEKGIGKKPVSFVISVLTLVLFELTLVLDNIAYNSVLNMVLMIVFFSLAIYNITKTRYRAHRIWYNILIALINFLGVICLIVSFFNIEWSDILQKVVTNSQVLIAELILFSHYFTKREATLDSDADLE